MKKRIENLAHATNNASRKSKKIRIPRWTEEMILEAARGENFKCFGVKMAEEDYNQIALTGEVICENGWVYVQLGTYTISRNFVAYCSEYPRFEPVLGYFRTVNDQDAFREYSLTDRIPRYNDELFLPKNN